MGSFAEGHCRQRQPGVFFRPGGQEAAHGVRHMIAQGAGGRNVRQDAVVQEPEVAVRTGRDGVGLPEFIRQRERRDLPGRGNPPDARTGEGIVHGEPQVAVGAGGNVCSRQAGGGKFGHQAGGGNASNLICDRVGEPEIAVGTGRENMRSSFRLTNHVHRSLRRAAWAWCSAAFTRLRGSGGSPGNLSEETDKRSPSGRGATDFPLGRSFLSKRGSASWRYGPLQDSQRERREAMGETA
jgi:hypothetical protein